MWNVCSNLELENISADKIFCWNSVSFEHSVYIEWAFVCACMDTHTEEACLSLDAFGSIPDICHSQSPVTAHNFPGKVTGDFLAMEDKRKSVEQGSQVQL